MHAVVAEIVGRRRRQDVDLGQRRDGDDLLAAIGGSATSPSPPRSVSGADTSVTGTASSGVSAPKLVTLGASSVGHRRSRDAAATRGHSSPLRDLSRLGGCAHQPIARRW